mgnify:CR=1 FL=1
MVIVLLILTLCLLSSSLYAFGFIPGTGSYAKKKLGVSNLSLKKLDKACDRVKKFDSDTKYFTLGGMKSLVDLISSDEQEKMEEIFDVCEKRDEGTVVTFDAFKDAVQGYDTVECEKFKTTMSDYQTKSIIHDGKLISHVDAYEKIYPKSIGRCYEN